MSKTICIQTALPDCEIFFDGELITFPSDKTQSEQLFAAIAQLTATKKPARILTVTGPGAFTGLRVGVTTANSILLALQIPVAGITTFQYLRARAGAEAPCALPGGRQVIWQASPDAAVEFISEEDFQNRLRENQQIISSSILSISPEKLVPLGDSRAAWEELIVRDRDWQKQIEPNYLREPHITPAKKL